ncbi:phosphate signaling complex protein PhoU [Zhaonella formicivorans]|uniref:phosphate signaling complex protein PhoU n=1 Tax=Zhaonella formicivorans TaxID=2528593 RepID=UPI0010DE6782|nr:phosphate signaling complex protein PhoU [Zhaonella formicivorans]
MHSNRTSFENALAELQQDILRMGSLVEEAIKNAILALTKQDVTLAEQVKAKDDLIDQLELEIEAKCMRLIATQQPMAKDLRRIGVGFKIIVDLERMADYASDIADITTVIAGEPLIKPLVDIPKMAELTQLMVKDALDAYVKEDVELAAKMCADDDEVDRLHKRVFDDVLALMTKDAKNIKQGTYLLFISRYLERIADHATNLGEGVIYLVTGERKSLNN